MKILMQMGDPWSINNPCTKRMTAFSNELERRGHEVIILAPNADDSGDHKNVVFCKTPPLRKKTTINRLLNQGCLAVSSYRKGRKVRGVDVVLTTCPPPLINMVGARLARKHGAKLIYDVRDIWPDVAFEMGSFKPGSIYARVFSYIKDYMIRESDLVMAVSSGKTEKLRKHALWQKVLCIPNGYNIAFGDIPINDKLYESIKMRGKFICTYIGNIGLAQGISQLIHLAELAKEREIDATFLVYGSGAEENDLRGYVKEHRLDSFSFEGILPNKDMRTVLEASDINFVSLVNGNLRDSVPTKLYEALGVGCPVLLAAEGDSADILKETGLGIAVSPNDQEALWDAFICLYQNQDMFRKNKDKAINLMNTKYSLQKSAEGFVSEVEKMLERQEI